MGEEVPSKKFFKVQIIILSIVLVVIFLEITSLVLHKYDKLTPVFDSISQLFKKAKDSGGEQSEGKTLTAKEKSSESSDEEMQKRIKDLEDKIKELEENQNVPFPGDYVVPPLTSEQISAIVELWCPDDNVTRADLSALVLVLLLVPTGLFLLTDMLYPMRTGALLSLHQRVMSLLPKIFPNRQE